MTRHETESNIEHLDDRRAETNQERPDKETRGFIKKAAEGIEKAKKKRVEEKEADEKVKAVWEVAERLAEYEGAELDIHINSIYRQLSIPKVTLIKAVEQKKREKEEE